MTGRERLRAANDQIVAQRVARASEADREAAKALLDVPLTEDQFQAKVEELIREGSRLGITVTVGLDRSREAEERALMGQPPKVTKVGKQTYVTTSAGQVSKEDFDRMVDDLRKSRERAQSDKWFKQRDKELGW